MRLPSVLHFDRSSLRDVRSSPVHQKMQFVVRKLTTMTDWCRIRFDLSIRNMRTLGTELFLLVLTDEQSLSYRVAGELGQCIVVSSLNVTDCIRINTTGLNAE